MIPSFVRVGSNLNSIFYTQEYISAEEEARLLSGVSSSKGRWVEVGHEQAGFASNAMHARMQSMGLSFFLPIFLRIPAFGFPVSLPLPSFCDWHVGCMAAFCTCTACDATPCARCHAACSPRPCATQLSGRRLQNYGGSVTAKGLLPAPIASWLQPLLTSLHADTGVFGDQPPNHVLVNEYRSGEGIMVRAQRCMNIR